MGLFNIACTYKCARCKKKISDGEFIWIGNHRFCLECEKQKSPEQPAKPKKPIISLFNQKDTKQDKQPSIFRCARCKKKVSDGEYIWIGNHRFCLECEKQKSPEQPAKPKNPIISLFNQKDTKQDKQPSIFRCARCKKKVSDGEFIWIGNHRFCLECEKPHTLDQLVKPAKPVITPSKIANAAQEDQKQRIIKCRRCKKEVSDGQYKCVDTRIFCLECAKLPIGYALDKNGDRYKFYYPVTDMRQEYEYWDNEIRLIYKRKRSDESIVRPENVKCIDMISIRTKEDYEYPLDSDFDWEINLWVYANDERNVWYFELHEDYLSEWDAFPVYRGGWISENEVKEYLHRIGNHTYDYLLLQ